MIMTHLEKKIKAIKNKIFQLGPMLPGSLKKQWNVCGKKQCKCKDPKNPKKHGPYYQLSFSIKGKSSTLFVKEKNVPEIKKRIKRFKIFKQLSNELIALYVQLVRKQFQNSTDYGDNHSDSEHLEPKVKS